MSNLDFINNANKTIKKKSIITEDDIETSFCKYATSKGCKALKLTLLFRKGFPDRTVLIPGGKIVFIEFKRKSKKASAPQIKVRKYIEDLGFKYELCDTIESAKKFLDDNL